MKQAALYKIIGMQKDVADSAMDKQHAFDIRNIRFRHTDTNSVTAMVNEEGNLIAHSSEAGNPEVFFTGTVLGCTTLNDTAIVFTHADLDHNSDRIYLINPAENNTYSVFMYFEGDLGFRMDHPIECTVYFENEEVQKVYWVDGINPLRYANIADRNGANPWTDSLLFDSVPELSLNEQVTITRNSTGGVFPSCTVQWCFTYLNRYGAESNIAWISAIHYSSPDDRGGAPSENCANSFTINIENYETGGRFDYIRLYHIVHTTQDTEPEVRRVADIPLPSNAGQVVTYTDTNTTGEAVDQNELLYLGGVSVIPHTLEQKSNTLFLGNLKQSISYLHDVIAPKNGTSLMARGGGSMRFVLKDTDIAADKRSGYYNHINQLTSNSWNITSFQRGEKYRFGFQAQDKTGRWSDVWWIGDDKSDLYPKFGTKTNGTELVLKTVGAEFDLTKSVVDALMEAGYRRVRPVVVYPQPWERTIYTEGLLNPTVYNVKNRANNAPFAQSSWFLRPFPPIDFSTLSGTDGFGNVASSIEDDGFTAHFNVPFPESTLFFDLADVSLWDSLLIDNINYNDKATYKINYGSWAEYRHNHPLGDSQQRNGEIQSMYNPREGYYKDRSSSWPLEKFRYNLTFPYTTAEGKKDFINDFSDFFYVDQSILTMNSADLEFDSVMQATSSKDYSFRVTGLIPLTSFIASFDITTNTPPNKFYTEDNDSMLIPQGLYNSETVGAKFEDEGYGWKSMINGAIWHDELCFNSVKDSTYKNDAHIPVGFAVYPWHSTGSLNNDSVGTRRVYPSDEDSKELKNKESRSNVGDNYISAELKTKTLANLHYSISTHTIRELDTESIKLNAKHYTVIDEQQVSLTKLDEPANSALGTLHYFGSVDELVMPVFSSFSGITSGNETTYKAYPLSRNGGFPIMAGYIPWTNHGDYGSVGRATFHSPYTPISVRNTLTGYTHSSISPLGYYWVGSNNVTKEGADRSMSPIPIKYKSCSHFVIALDYDKSGDNVSQPYFSWGGISERNNLKTFSSDDPFWTDGLHNLVECKLFNHFNAETTVDNTTVPSTFDGVQIEEADGGYNMMLFDGSRFDGYLYMGQLYREDEFPNKFGGTSLEALEQNVWLPAGPSVKLVHLETDNDVLTLRWDAGDTYYQRYDALRTYPFTEEDQNKVIDIVSYMTETHINIDGRYDKNRGLTNNNHCRPTNFNKMNYVYSQRDNFFTYHTLNPNKVNLDNFEYSFTWSMQKVAGALRDEWTHVTLANTYDCDGNKGSITSINRLDNNLVAFQESGVAQILYNENVQIQGSEGVPIELANSGKVTGVRYFSTEIGCQNKWSIAVFPNGIYWVDGRMKEFCVLSDGIAQLSMTKLMSSWFKKRDDFITSWLPSQWHGFISHRDITTGELFLTGSDVCLCYDTTTQEFTSFYDYNETLAMFTLNGKTLTIAEHRTKHSVNLWRHRASKFNYCSFYGKSYPFWFEVVCNSNNQGTDYGMDKVFDNMSWRADVWRYTGKDTWQYKPFVTFTSMRGFDDYQKFGLTFDAVNGDADNDNVAQLSHPQMPLNLRKKFKVWYTTMPRSDESKTDLRPTGSDRIRDTWCHIKLIGSDSVSNYRHIMHDLSITYFIP